MTVLKTRFDYHTSILNHPDAVKIISKLEKVAVKHGLHNEVTARIDSEGIIFYDIKLFIRKCNLNNDENYMYLYFQFVPSDKYFEVLSDSWSSLVETYPPLNVNFSDTILSSALSLSNNFTSWENINDFFVVLGKIAKSESQKYLGDNYQR